MNPEIRLKRVEGGYEYEPLGLFIYREEGASSHEWVCQAGNGGTLYSPSLAGVRAFIAGLTSRGETTT